MFTLLVVLVVLYQNQEVEGQEEKNERKDFGFQLTCEKFENKTKKKR